MNPHHHSTLWLLESQLAPYVDAFTQHLIERRYASHTADSYLACIAHFDHLPRCECAKQVYRVRQDLRAALGHLLVVLRNNAVIADPPVGTTPVDDELRCFDESYEPRPWAST